MKTLLAALMVVAITSGCELKEEPRCLEGHTTLIFQPFFNGKTTTFIPMHVFHCDVYETTTAVSDGQQ